MNKIALKKSIRFQVILYGLVGIVFLIIHTGYGMQLLLIASVLLLLLCAIVVALTLYDHYDRES